MPPDHTRRENFLTHLSGCESTLRAFIAGALAAAHERADFFQEVVLILWRRYDDYDAARPFLPWAMGVAARRMKEEYRRVARRPGLLPPDELDRLRGYDLSIEHRLPASVTVSARLPLDQIVAGVRDRLITPAQTPLANLRQFARQLERDGRPLEMIGRAYAAQFPELEITVPELSDHRGSIRGGAPIGLLGDFYSDGCVSIERMELTRAQFERVIRALRDEE